jgi:hypothetical protein
MVGSLYKYAACFKRKPYWQAGKPHIVESTMTNENNGSWVNYSFSELGPFGEQIAEIKDRLIHAYAEQEEVSPARVRVSLGKYGVGFLIVEETQKANKPAFGTPKAKAKAFTAKGPRSPRLK